jgi:hypothetical protein
MIEGAFTRKAQLVCARLQPVPNSQFEGGLVRLHQRGCWLDTATASVRMLAGYCRAYFACKQAFSWAATLIE